MVTGCLPLPQTVAGELLAVAARAVCDRPGESPAQCASRTEQLVHSCLGFGPRDGLEYILATMVFGHWGMILDSMHDVHVGMTASLKARTKSGIVQLDRLMMDMVRELRTMGVRPTLAARPAEVPVAAAVEVLAAAVDGPVEESKVEADVTPVIEAPVVVSRPPSSRPAAPAVPALPSGQVARAVAPMRAPSTQPAIPPAPGTMLELVETMGDPALTAHVVAFEKALAAVNETLAEAKAEERARTNGKAVAGD
jgi:hypothetical protein